MPERAVRIRARINLLPSEEGGRAGPIMGSYRPNHNFLDANNRNMAMGFIDLEPGVIVRPGESIEIEMTLFPWPVDSDLSPGREWRIQEGHKLVGTGTILEIVSDERTSS